MADLGRNGFPLPIIGSVHFANTELHVQQVSLKTMIWWIKKLSQICMNKTIQQLQINADLTNFTVFNIIEFSADRHWCEVPVLLNSVAQQQLC